MASFSESPQIYIIDSGLHCIRLAIRLALAILAQDSILLVLGHCMGPSLTTLGTPLLPVYMLPVPYPPSGHDPGYGPEARNRAIHAATLE